MAAESPRIAELRRRVQSDPASIAFAQLAEEYRRAGQYQDAVQYCRNGLARHPGYLSARVTLGRALIELGILEEAAREFDLVLRSAPDNLAAIRGMAEIHQRGGAMEPALDYYKRALALARFDPELAESVNRIGHELRVVNQTSAADGLSHTEPHNQLASTEAGRPSTNEPQSFEEAPPRGEAADLTPPSHNLIDFDALLATLGMPEASPPPVMEMLLSAPSAAVALTHTTSPELPELPAEHSTTADPFHALEHELREFDARPTAQIRESEVNRFVQELESWLEVLVSERDASATSTRLA